MNALKLPSKWKVRENLTSPRRLLSTLAVAGGLALAAGAFPPDALA